ncbi:Hypothetical predicted protein [Paramuricea clavata]|uniref:Uncharacterized protein n=1 Tax=Paramuricea clavata TaxID=317549 RepID=A0A7D9E7V9_PARCT|nr:Hypothetical predicted protein [Paramuricea clavata]
MACIKKTSWFCVYRLIGAKTFLLRALLCQSIAVEKTTFVSTIALVSLVTALATAHQVNIAVIVVKVLVANVLDLVLENHVKRMISVDQVNIVVLMEHVLPIVLENFVLPMATAQRMNHVVAVIKVVTMARVLDLVLVIRVNMITTAEQARLTATWRRVFHERETQLATATWGRVFHERETQLATTRNTIRESRETRLSAIINRVVESEEQDEGEEEEQQQPPQEQPLHFRNLGPFPNQPPPYTNQPPPPYPNEPPPDQPPPAYSSLPLPPCQPRGRISPPPYHSQNISPGSSDPPMETTPHVIFTDRDMYSSASLF